jgi:hypothetical protein
MINKLFYSVLFHSIIFYSILFYSTRGSWPRVRARALSANSLIFYSIIFDSILFCFPNEASDSSLRKKQAYKIRSCEQIGYSTTIPNLILLILVGTLFILQNEQHLTVYDIILLVLSPALPCSMRRGRPAGRTAGRRVPPPSPVCRTAQHTRPATRADL